MTQLVLGMFLLAAGEGDRTPLVVKRLPYVQPRIVNGTVDQGDPGVIELYGFSGYAPAACNGDATCLQGCRNAQNQACSSGAGCACGAGFICTSELIGPHTLLTAGHCTDLTPGGEISGQGGPQMTVCTNPTDANAVLTGTLTSNCNLVMFAIFNNQCTTNDANSSCELGLISGVDGGQGGGNYILVDQMVNPGYSPNVSAPGNDNDVGLCHLSSTTLVNGGAEPALLTFNRTDEGSACTDLGNLKFVGYGITSGSGQVAGVKMSVSADALVLDSYHNFEGQNPNANCSGNGSDPTCSGDSGGPSLNASGAIMGTTSLGDAQCASFGQDARADAYQTFYDCQMQCWGDPINGGAPAPSCTGYGCVYAPAPPSSSSSSSSGGASSTGGGSSTGSSSGSSTGSTGSSSGSGSSTGSTGGSSSGGTSTGAVGSSSSGSGSGASGGASTSGTAGGSSGSSSGGTGESGTSGTAGASSSSNGGIGSASTGSGQSGGANGSGSEGPAASNAKPHALPSAGCSTGPGGGDAPLFGALIWLGLAVLRRRGRTVA